MSSNGQNTNNNQDNNSNGQAAVIPAGDPNQVLPPGTVGKNPHSSLNLNGNHRNISNSFRR